jgi:5,5'-dehydrodivanillate O-demethylase oxygenase subunit
MAVLPSRDTDERAAQVPDRPEWSDYEHTGPGTLAGRYLRLYWQPVAVSADIAPGRAKPIRVMSEDLTLYRGESGDVHLIAFRCAHRGTQLSTGWVEGDELRCFYHGWKYDGAGQCTEQPAEPEPFCNRIKIRSYPVQEYLGLIFAYLGEGELPELLRYPDFEVDGVLDSRADPRECNYFQNFENLCDSVHVSFVHRKSRPGLTDMPIPMVSGEENAWGMLMRYDMPGNTARISHVGMPNVKYGQVPPAPDLGTGPCDKLMWCVPIDDERHVQYSVELCHATGELGREYREKRTAARSRLTTPTFPLAQEILSGSRSVHDIDEDRDLVQIVRLQDDVAQIGQRTIAVRSEDHLGRSDANIAMLRQLWTRELRALAEGRPLTQWSRTPDTMQAMWSRPND